MNLFNLLHYSFLIVTAFFLILFNLFDTTKISETYRIKVYDSISNNEELLSHWSDDYLDIRVFKKKIILTSKIKASNLGFYFTDEENADLQNIELYFKHKFSRTISDKVNKTLICEGRNYCLIQYLYNTNIFEIDEKLIFLKKKYNFVFINNQWRKFYLNNEEL